MVEHGQQTEARFLAVLAPGDQLAKHRIVERRHGIALGDAAVDATARAIRCFTVEIEGAGGGEEIVVRVFGVQPYLDGVADQRHLLLADRQRLAAGDANLPGDQIEAGDGFGDRVLDLQAGIHFHEEEFSTGIQQEFHGAGTDVADGLGRLYRSFAHGAAQLGGEAWRRRLFNHFLMAALDRAVAFVQVQAVAVLVGEDLDFHMARFEHVFLDQHARIAERRLRLALGGRQRLGQVRLAFDHLHALAAATGGGLEQHRVADLFRGSTEGFHVLRFAVVARHQRHAGFFHQRLGGGLAAHGVDGRGGWAEEDQPGLFDGAGELGVLRKKTVAGVDRLGTAGLGGIDQLVDAQVTVGRLGAAQVDADVSFAGVARRGVDGAVHGNGGQAHGLGGAHYAAGDLAAVGNQEGRYHFCDSCVAWKTFPLTLALSPMPGAPEGRGDDGVRRSNDVVWLSAACRMEAAGRASWRWPRGALWFFGCNCIVLQTPHGQTPSPPGGEGWGEGAMPRTDTAARPPHNATLSPRVRDNVYERAPHRSPVMTRAPARPACVFSGRHSGLPDLPGWCAGGRWPVRSSGAGRR